MNNKRYPAPNQMQYNARPTPYSQGPQGVPPGAAGSAPRNSAPQNMRVQQNGPRQPQPHQQQGQVQPQQHSGMSGVGVPGTGQLQHGQAPQQGQAQPHPQQAQYFNPGQHYILNAFPSYQMPPGQHASFLQQQGIQQRFVFMPSPGSVPAGNFQVFYPGHPYVHGAAHQGQPSMVQQQHPAAAQHANYYGQPNFMPQNRLPMHPVHSGAVQVPPPSHPPPPGHAPQTSQHNHPIPHVPQPAANISQVASRTDGTPAPPSASKRERKILKIVDPNTGVCVIGDSDANNTSTTETPPATESSSAEGNGDAAASEASRESQSPAEMVAQGPAPASTEEPAKSDRVVAKVVSEDQGPDESKSKARAEFFQKITQASDDGNARSASAASAQGAVVDPPSPIAGTPAPEQPESPPIDSSKSQQAVTTPAVNTSSDDSKDASLVSVSPIPIECYLTPSKTARDRESGNGRCVEEEFEEAQHEDESLSTTVETNENEVVSPNQDEVQLPESESSTVDVDSPSCHEDVETKEDADEDQSSDNEKSEEPSRGATPSEEQASVAHHNGGLDLEEGEINPEDDDESETGADDSTPNDTDNKTSDSEARDKQADKGPKKYDRSTLLEIREKVKVQPKLSGGILSELAKDATSRSNMSKSPGGPRGDQFRMGRSGPGGMGPRSGLGGPMGMNFPGRGGQGMGMNWGMGIHVPPRLAPPKVIELTREEVKLHKAENAWKPTTKVRGSGNEQVDPEEAVTDDIVKKTRGILNKLTPDNFDKLVQKFMELKLEDRDERISKVIKVVFEKAVDEPSFSKEYAKMVQQVYATSVETSKKFRKLILDQCQQEFQNTNTDEDKIKEYEQQILEAEAGERKDALKAELDDYRFQSRRRSLGNVRFIGELYKFQMLTPKIMIECVNLLLGRDDEENLECLCKLFTTVGAKLEQQLKEVEARAMAYKSYRGKPDDPNAPKPIKFVPPDNWMTNTFGQLRTLSENKKYSSRIRFALLDVVELRDNNWKPRRDTNAPKTIEEVRKDAIRQEAEEKRQISNLPPPPMDRGSSRAGSSQPKKGDWTTQQPKSSRFAVKKNEPTPSSITFAPPSHTNSNSVWGRNAPKPQPQLPPRFAAQNQNRFHTLAAEERERDARDRLNPNHAQLPPPGLREPAGSAGPSFGPPFASSSGKPSPAPSSTSSRENSRPVSPKDSVGAADDDFDVNETVKNIFEEYCSFSIIVDAIDWINKRFPGDKAVEFVDELSRQVGEMSKVAQQQKAGCLIRSLIKSNDVKLTKDSVIETLCRGVIADLPDIRIDVPMVSTYLAQFLVEIFQDEPNLDWLVALEDGLKTSEDYESSWTEFCNQIMKTLRAKLNEENARSLFTATKECARIDAAGIPWLCPDPESIAQDMVPVLKNHVGESKDSSDEVRQALKEHSWDLREDLVNHSLTEAICILAWITESGKWNENILNQLIPVLPTNKKLFPDLWKRVERFCTRNNVNKDQREIIWQSLYSHDKAVSAEQPSD